MKRLFTILMSVGLASSMIASEYAVSREMASFDFEEAPTDHGWRSYDLDGKSTYFFGKPRGWYMSFEGDNGVCAATSLFNYNVDNNNFVTPVTVPANDWLFSPTVEIPAEGSFRLSWDSRAGGDYDMEDYEVRVIDAELLDRLEAGFTSAMTLKEVAEIMIENTSSLGFYECQDNVWRTHQLGINKLRGKTVRFIWRYCSNHTQVVYIDNFLVWEESGRSFDTSPIALPEIPGSYACVASFMTNDLSSPAFEITNVENHDLEDVTIGVTISTDGNEDKISLIENLQSIGSGETAIVNTSLDTDETKLMLSSPYTMTVSVSSPSGNSDDITIRKEEATELSDNIIAWETGETEYYFSLGGTDLGKEIGQRFPIWNDADLTAVRFSVSDRCDADQTEARLYEVTETGGIY